eukprot:9630688-Lingulodinium_polyedra.AAC.2
MLPKKPNLLHQKRMVARASQTFNLVPGATSKMHGAMRMLSTTLALVVYLLAPLGDKQDRSDLGPEAKTLVLTHAVALAQFHEPARQNRRLRRAM